MCVCEKESDHTGRDALRATHTVLHPSNPSLYISFSHFLLFSNLSSLQSAPSITWFSKCSALWAWTQVLCSGTVWNKCIGTYADMSDDCTQGHMKHAQDHLRKQTRRSSPLHSCSHWSNGPVFGVLGSTLGPSCETTLYQSLIYPTSQTSMRSQGWSWRVQGSIWSRDEKGTRKEDKKGVKDGAKGNEKKPQKTRETITKNWIYWGNKGRGPVPA